jgi:glyoxylase-like metal-dependent hydrolase (beta-lactamase superfamily II)
MTRSFAFVLVAFVCALPAAAQVRTADPAKRGLTDADFPRITRLADDVYAYEQLRSAGEERFTTVSLFVVTADGVLVADGQGSEAETQRLVDEIAKLTLRPVTHVVIGSDHGDHTAGNAAFPATATYYAHPTSIAVLEEAATRSAGAGGQRVAYTPVHDRTVLTIGGTEIHLLFLGRAHTGGDLSVYLPASKVLFMSEAYLNRVFPAMRSAYPSEWVATIEKAQALDVDVYVPGHGFVDPPAVLEEELETFRRALVQVITEGRRLHEAGIPVEDAVAQAEFGDLETWSLRASQGPIAIRRVYLELAGKLPGQAGTGSAARLPSKSATTT